MKYKEEITLVMPTDVPAMKELIKAEEVTIKIDSTVGDFDIPLNQFISYTLKTFFMTDAKNTSEWMEQYRLKENNN